MIRAFLFTLLLIPLFTKAQVVLRDTALVWQHHDFVLTEDHSMMAYTTRDDEITEVMFSTAKVIENELIKLVVVPEYGGRVISFVYKPTGHEYLYQAECGSPYGIGDGNFYYNWLMVYGGIFPTFTEPEHGKAWLLPFDFTVEEETSERVHIRMVHTDEIDFSGAPGQFNNGRTNITCQVDVTVDQNSAAWDFDVTLINNNSTNQNYEYWTCTTLSPGSEIGETGSPLSSKIIAPVNDYRAAWSPGNWIGDYGSLGDFSSIDELEEWDDMGIAYADEISGNYWGVINQENQEGIIRISENVKTPGLKLWTWGRNNVNNDLFDFSNGGADNYIELWAGTSLEFFSDAFLSENETKTWKETYVATTGMTGVSGINSKVAINLEWDSEAQLLVYELNSFQMQRIELVMSLEGNSIEQKVFDFEPKGLVGSVSLAEVVKMDGEYVIDVSVANGQGDVLIELDKEVFIDILEPLSGVSSVQLVAYSPGSGKLSVISDKAEGLVQVVDIQGKTIHRATFNGQDLMLDIPNSGLYIVSLKSEDGFLSKRVLVK